MYAAGSTPAVAGLHELAQRGFRAFQDPDEQAHSFLVRPAIPILWFGDVESYRNSAVRVMTVGLNPSRAEFPATEAFRRFRSAEHLKDVSETKHFEQYSRALCSYFAPERDPYRPWFRSFEPILNGLGSSYYPGAASTAVHTDICSPLATDPTWSRLPHAARESLIGTGRPLWHDLVRELAPHVILMSVARSHLQNIEFPAESDWATVHTVERANPYVVTARVLRIDQGRTATLVFGRASQQPFGAISDAEKRLLGEKLSGGPHG